jgi:hypothetical protein
MTLFFWLCSVPPPSVAAAPVVVVVTPVPTSVASSVASSMASSVASSPASASFEVFQLTSIKLIVKISRLEVLEFTSNDVLDINCFTSSNIFDVRVDLTDSEVVCVGWRGENEGRAESESSKDEQVELHDNRVESRIKGPA